ncbi:unnamed protein product [Microthlaspi erraticum]|uniref:Ubiquitin-like protease family profile domain-containing protein n=1 Tax=Microthlaspi erraticum TaxID=1685480 RepID=A0A6D2HV37_9BRAS|nr:unnamed protein product [Microthlaspi erraticum]
MTEQKDEKYKKLASDFAKLQGVVTELKDMLTEALSRGNNGEPTSQSKPVSQVNYEQRRKAQFDVSLDKLVDINLTQSSEINFGENTQSYLFRKQGHLSQDSFVPGFDPSQQSKDKSKKSQPRNQKAKDKNTAVENVSKEKGKISQQKNQKAKVKPKKAEHVITEKDTHEDTSKREGKAVKTEPNGSTKDPKAAEVDSDTEDVLKVLACLTRPIKRRPLYSDSDEDQDGEDREFHESQSKLMQDHPLSEDPDAFLWYISEERYEELHEWSQTFVDIKVGPMLLTWALSNRVVGPGGPEKWLKNEEIDGLLYVFRENTTLKRWDVDRVGFMNFNFACCIKAAYEQWKSVKKKFEVSEYLMAFGKGILPAHGRTDKVWGVDFDRIYTPVSVGGNHWIALCINFSERVIDVFDCNGLKRYREVDAFTHMVPRIMKEVQTGETKKNLSVAPYTARYVPMRDGMNETHSDCEVYTLKFIECHALGRDVSLLNDENMKYARYKIASDLLQAGRDEVLLERMSRHVTPEFAPTETIDIGFIFLLVFLLQFP